MSDKRSIRRRAHYLARKVIALLCDNDEGYRIRLQRLKGNKKLCIKKYAMSSTNIYGLVDFASCLIVADFRYNPLNTIIHEVLHVLYPDAPEKDVCVMEKLVMKHLTENQAIAIWTYATDCMRVT